MNTSSLFLQRYDPLYTFYFSGFWAHVPHDLMRLRPHLRTNSIAWNFWHLTRAEDAGLNRFVVDRPQVFDEGGWGEKINLPWRHHGTGMTLAEVDDLNQRIDLSALHDYSHAVQERTREIIQSIDAVDLDAVMEEERLTQILAHEGLAHSNAEGFVKNYLGWSKAKCLFLFGMTHPYQHLGEMEVLAALAGVVFE